MTHDCHRPVRPLATPLLVTALLSASAPPARAAQEIEDQDVVQAIEWELATARWVPENDIDVRCVDGVVTLSGEVPHLLTTWTYEDWDPVLHDHDFDYATIRRKPDREIVEDIENQLRWSPFVDEDEVTVTVEDGVATLTGRVDTWSERSAAEENAIEGGAHEVRNLLDIDFGDSQ